MSTLSLVLDFHALARRPDIRRSGRRWDVVVKVDGVEHSFEEGPRHQLEVTPGPRDIEVVFRPAGAMFLARWLGLTYGAARIRIDVPASGEVELTYTGSMFWHMGGGRSLARTE